MLLSTYCIFTELENTKPFPIRALIKWRRCSMTPYVKNAFGFYMKVVFSIRLDIKPLATSHMSGVFHLLWFLSHNTWTGSEFVLQRRPKLHNKTNFPWVKTWQVGGTDYHFYHKFRNVSADILHREMNHCMDFFFLLGNLENWDKTFVVVISSAVSF